MRNRIGILGAIGTAVVALTLGAAPAAEASFGVSKWEAGTCKSDTVPGNAPTRVPKPSSSPRRLGTHRSGLTDFAMNTTGGVPDGAIKDAGSICPRASTSIRRRCPSVRKRPSNRMPSSAVPPSQVGISEVTSEIAGLPVGPLAFPVYNLDPPQGEPALFGFTVGLPLIPIANVYLVADVAWDSDYHEGFTISDIPTTLPLVENRLVFDGTKGGTFLTMGSQCNAPSTHHPQGRLLRRDSGQPSRPTRRRRPGLAGPSTATAASRFRSRPSISTAPGIDADRLARRASRSTLKVPQGLQPLNSSTLKTASVSLPRGLGLNPPRRQRPAGLQRRPVRQGHQEPGRLSRRLADRHRLDRDAGAARRLADRQGLPRPAAQPRPDLRPGVPGLRRRRVGSLRTLGAAGRQRQRQPADRPADGDLRQQPAGRRSAPSSSTLDGGAKGAADQPADLRAEHRPRRRSRPGRATPPATPANGFTLTNAPGGGACAKTMAARPFAPGFKAEPEKRQRRSPSRRSRSTSPAATASRS